MQRPVSRLDKGGCRSHIIRRCHIHHCEQTGIVGRMGAVFSAIEDCHIHHICNSQQLGGAETAGIKLHAAVDVTIRRNHIFWQNSGNAEKFERKGANADRHSGRKSSRQTKKRGRRMPLCTHLSRDPPAARASAHISGP